MEGFRDFIWKVMNYAECITMFCQVIEAMFLYMIVRFAYKIGERVGRAEAQQKEVEREKQKENL